MNSLNASVLLLLGGVLLYLGAEWLVRGGAGLARRFGISPLIIGLTVVAYGTSAPEVIVGIQAGWTGHGQLALGNVIGSNIVNLGVILGLTVLVRPAPVTRELVRLEVPVLLGSTALLAMFLIDGRLRPWESLILLLLAVAYSLGMIWRVRRDAEEDLHVAVTEAAAEAAGAPPGGSKARLAVLVAVGLVVLVLGGSLFLEGAVRLAKTFGWSERMIGLTIVAIGTSLPELATSGIAAFRGHTDMAVGNVVGSNIFNILLCLGAAGLPRTLEVLPTRSNHDLQAMALITVLAAAFLRAPRRIRRWEGGALLSGYAAYMSWLLTRL